MDAKTNDGEIKYDYGEPQIFLKFTFVRFLSRVSANELRISYALEKSQARFLASMMFTKNSQTFLAESIDKC